jgi:probable HAF family extracellular repeat protein
MTHYTVQDLGTLGGTFSWAQGVNNKGTVAGHAAVLGDTSQHAFLWRKGRMTDLGTLGGPNSISLSKPNESDEVVGHSDGSFPSPDGADHCGFGTYLSCLPFLWRHGMMTPLPTLDSNGVAYSINNRGQVVGNTLTSTPSVCPITPFQFKPVVWERGHPKELSAIPGDDQGYAAGINDRGQISGFSVSSDCGTLHAVLWDKGTVADLGSLGGTVSVATAINNLGQVPGYSSLLNDTTTHGFLWQKSSGMNDLGAVAGDIFSIAWGVNDKGQVVGGSCDETGNCRGFLWQHGEITDINTLIDDGSSWFVVEGDGINSREEIAGAALNVVTGEVHAILLIPSKCSIGADCDALAARANVARPTVVLPHNIRQLLQQRLTQRYPARGVRLAK